MTDGHGVDEVTASARRVFLVATFLRWSGPGLVSPVMVLLLAERGLDLADIGVVFAAYGLTTTVAELPTGGLADALGRRPVMVAAALLFALFDLGLVLGAGLATFVLAAVAGGMGRALGSGPLEAWFVDRVRHRQPDLVLRPDLSRAGVAKGAALTIGALAATLITVLADGDGVGGIDLVALPVAAAVVADLVLAAMVAMTMRDPARPRGPAALRRAVRDIPAVVRDGARLGWSTTMLKRVLAANLAIAVAIVAIEVLWQPRLVGLVGDTATAARLAGVIVAAFMLAATVGSALAQHLPTRIADRPGPAAAMAMGLMILGIGALSVAGTALLLALSLVFVYATTAMSGVLRRELLHDWVPSSRRATMVSISSLVGQAGTIVASLVVAPLALSTSIPLAWLVSGGVVAAGAVTIATARLPARARA